MRREIVVELKFAFVLVGTLLSTQGEVDELIAEVDESRGVTFVGHLKLEKSTVELQCRFDVSNFQRQMINADGSCFSFVRSSHVVDFSFSTAAS